ncbi:hypothetical protein Vadar_029322 [Vaccinium darrowii]|uniref:Uncharacterized protein n=1 Tax=Vaccinium darrowii TaxID=229202 RepID=A0ACB7YI49_9ERIC|nr:hypothetical protein Vadar_029322 [Vaccinium darrowii]
MPRLSENLDSFFTSLNSNSFFDATTGPRLPPRSRSPPLHFGGVDGIARSLRPEGVCDCVNDKGDHVCGFRCGGAFLWFSRRHRNWLIFVSPSHFDLPQSHNSRLKLSLSRSLSLSLSLSTSFISDFPLRSHPRPTRLLPHLLSPPPPLWRTKTQIRVSGVLTNAPFMLNLDCDHYINNSKAVREAMCFLMDAQLGKKVCYVQCPQRFDGIDRNDRYANRNTVFFDINMKGLDGIQDPVYVGTGCVFRRQALYGYEPPKGPKRPKMVNCDCCPCFGRRKNLPKYSKRGANEDGASIQGFDDDKELFMSQMNFEKKFGQSAIFVTSTLMVEGGVPPSSSPAALLKEAIHLNPCVAVLVAPLSPLGSRSHLALRPVWLPNMDKSWISIKNKMSIEYRDGVKSFVDFAIANTGSDDAIRCP